MDGSLSVQGDINLTLYTTDSVPAANDIDYIDEQVQHLYLHYSETKTAINSFREGSF